MFDPVRVMPPKLCLIGNDYVMATSELSNIVSLITINHKNQNHF
jgi:hypothetical protein